MQEETIACSRRLLLAGMSATALWWTTPVAAQSAAARPAEAADATAENEIIVTAQRRSERLVDVPATVVSISGKQFEQTGITRFQDFGQAVAGVQIGVTGPLTQPSIRGITTTTAGTGAENNVAVYIDGFFQSSQNSINQDLANIQSIEVLKGPQGALYGRNATGGAILINTLTPGNDLAAKASLSYGRFQDLNASGYASIPIVKDLLAASVVGNWHQNNGYIKDINCFADPVHRTVPGAGTRKTFGCNTAEYDSRSVRVKVRATPWDGVSVTLGYNYYYTSDGRTLAYQVNNHPSATIKAILAGTPPASAGGYAQAFQMRDRTSLNHAPIVINHGHEFTMAIEIETGDFGKLSSHTSYAEERGVSNFDIDASPVDATNIQSTPFQRTVIEQLDYEYHGIKNFTLLAGGMYYHNLQRSPLSRTAALAVASAANPLGILQTSSTILDTPNSYSFYVDGTYNLSDSLFLTAGGRYTKDEKSADFFLLNAAGVLVSQRAPGQTGKHSWTNFSPRAIIRYNISNSVNLYASYSQGFKSGTFNTAVNFVTPVSPEKVNAYEIGAKISRPNFHIETSAYYYDYKNLQISKTVFNPVTNALQSAIANATKSRNYGIDLSGDFKVTSSLTFGGGISWLHARYRSFKDATGTDTRIDTQTELNSAASNPQDWSGLPAVRAPNLSGNFHATYETEVAGGRLQATVSGYATTKYAPKDDSLIRFVDATGATVENTGKRRYVQPGYVTVNTQLNWTDPSGRLTVGGFIRNITNTRYRITYTSTTSGDYATFSEPRLYGVRVAVQY